MFVSGSYTLKVMSKLSLKASSCTPLTVKYEVDVAAAKDAQTAVPSRKERMV